MSEDEEKLNVPMLTAVRVTRGLLDGAPISKLATIHQISESDVSACWEVTIPLLQKHFESDAEPITDMSEFVADNMAAVLGVLLNWGDNLSRATLMAESESKQSVSSDSPSDTDAENKDKKNGADQGEIEG